jgi:sarcosine oxidase subunit alpha
VAAARDGAAAGLTAAKDCGFSGTALRFEVAGETPARDAPGAAPREPAAGAAKAFVDFQNDVTSRDLALAAQEGFRSIEHVNATRPSAWRPTRARPRT